MNDTSKKPPLELFTADMPTDYIATNGDEYVLKSKYQSLQAEIEHLKRMLADERSGDCDKDKTIRRLGSNYQSLLEQCEKLAELLESARDTVSTHAMLTYSKVSDRKVKEADEALAEFRKRRDGL